MSGPRISSQSPHMAAKRAPLACLSCRARKVRCNVMESGQPCMNCHLDGKSCVVNERKIRRAMRGVGLRKPQPKCSVFKPRDGQQPLDEHESPQAGCLSPYPEEQEEILIDVEITYCAYPFLRVSNIHTMKPRDVSHLESQSCLRVPTKATLEKFVTKYFEFVHPMMPFLLEGEFWDMYGHSPKSGQQISLMLFQAMLFASSVYLSTNDIKSLGFHSIAAARAAFYRRAKLLFDLGTESCSIDASRTALLLNDWCPKHSTRLKEPDATWLGVAVQCARQAKADIECFFDTVKRCEDEALWRRQTALKRLWCCCVVQDCIQALTRRRPLYIPRSEFDPDDNRICEYEDLSGDAYEPRVAGDKTKAAQIEAFVQMTQLCLVLRDVLPLLYPSETISCGKVNNAKRNLDAARFKAALCKWYEGSGLQSMVGLGNRFQKPLNAPGANTLSQWSSIFMYYHSAKLALCHYEAVELLPVCRSRHGGTQTPAGLRGLCSEIEASISCLVNMAVDLIHQKAARLLPINSMFCLVLPLATLLMEENKPSQKARHESAARIEETMTSRRQNLVAITALMRDARSQYHDIDLIIKTINYVAGLHGPNSCHGLIPCSRPLESSLRPLASSDILYSRPALYLRLAAAIDTAIGKWRIPEEVDLPANLQVTQLWDSSTLSQNLSQRISMNNMQSPMSLTESILDTESKAVVEKLQSGSTCECSPKDTSLGFSHTIQGSATNSTPQSDVCDMQNWAWDNYHGVGLHRMRTEATKIPESTASSQSYNSALMCPSGEETSQPLSSTDVEDSADESWMDTSSFFDAHCSELWKSAIATDFGASPATATQDMSLGHTTKYDLGALLSKALVGECSWFGA